MGGKHLFDSLEITLTPGQRIGLLGVNGSGKTTLLKMMAGELEPDTGTIKRAAELRIVTFSQHRGTLDQSQTLQEALCPVGDMVDYRGKMVHVTGWARRFLFEPDQLSTYVHNLSGGEQARLLIANLTHDRFMLERIATEYVGLDDEGQARHFLTYAQWNEHRRELKRGESERKSSESPAAAPPAKRPAASTGTKRKLSFNEKHEYERMEEPILDAESRVEEVQAKAADTTLMSDHLEAARIYEELAAAEQVVKDLYARWAELESIREGSPDA